MHGYAGNSMRSAVLARFSHSWSWLRSVECTRREHNILGVIHPVPDLPHVKIWARARPEWFVCQPEFFAWALHQGDWRRSLGSASIELSSRSLTIGDSIRHWIMLEPSIWRDFLPLRKLPPVPIAMPCGPARTIIRSIVLIGTRPQLFAELAVDGFPPMMSGNSPRVGRTVGRIHGATRHRPTMSCVGAVRMTAVAWWVVA